MCKIRKYLFDTAEILSHDVLENHYTTDYVYQLEEYITELEYR
jgi:hypothetical protein